MTRPTAIPSDDYVAEWHATRSPFERRVLVYVAAVRGDDFDARSLRACLGARAREVITESLRAAEVFL